MNTNLKRILTISGIILCLAILVIINTHYVVTAQDEAIDIKSRLEQLRDELNAGNLMIGFQFVVPISEGENYWLLGDATDERQLAISEIGNDYFCFSETSVQAVLIRCVPFTNIASFDYLSN
jgi:hypothetical protein